jgi:hypothetical protein
MTTRCKGTITMPKTPGASARQATYTSKLASIEPEGIQALAVAAMALLDAINAGKLVATNPDTRALLEATYPLQDALHGASDALPADLAAFLETVEELAGHDFKKTEQATPQIDSTVYCISPKTTRFEVGDLLEEKLAQLDALLAVTYGEQGASFRMQNESLQDNYMWCCSRLASEIRELHDVLRSLR